MSIFNESYEDGPERPGSAGPRLGFLGAYEAAYDYQTRTWAMFAVEQAFYEAEAEQLDAVEHATGTRPVLPGGKNTGRYPLYIEMARFFEGGGSPETAERIEQLDAEVLKAREQVPELKTYRELWDDLKGRAREASARWGEASTSTGDAIGGFIGEVAGAFDPRYDPANFVSLGFGGVGKTAVQRIGAQAGAGVGTEAINQVTGVQENRRLLGLGYGFDQAVRQVLFAGVAAGAFQGGGELIGAGLRKFFGKSETPDAPPPAERTTPTQAEPLAPAPVVEPPDVLRPTKLFNGFDDFMKEVNAPIAASRLGDLRLRQELDATAARLESFDEPAIFAPETATALPRSAEGFRVETPWWLEDDAAMTSRLARQRDPELFRQLDAIERHRQDLRSRMSTTQAVDPSPDSARLAEIDAQIAALRAGATSKRALQRVQREIDRLATERRNVAQRSVTLPDEARNLAEELARLDENELALQPLKKHVESAVRGDLQTRGPPSSGVVAVFARLQASGLGVPPSVARAATPNATPPRNADATPNGETPVETATRNVAESADELDGGDMLLTRVKQALADENPDATIDLGAGPVRLDQSVIIGTAFDAAGREVAETQTLRELLREIGDDDAMLAAMKVCAR